MPESITLENVPQAVKNLRNVFKSKKTLGYDWRMAQLAQLKKMIEENKDEIVEAVRQDLGKPKIEILASEINLPLTEIEHTMGNLYYWMQPERVATPVAAQPATSYIYKDPDGVVLVISPWNYPVNLALIPLSGAIAGGNACLLKLSRHSRKTGETIGKLVQKYMDPEAIMVEWEGGAQMITKLIEEKWDHIFFTGSVSVGRIVYQAAAKYLSKVTLELGGKNPCIVDSDVDVNLAAKRIVWGKFWNAGQTCITADYLLVHKDIEDKLIEALKRTIKEFYGEDPKTSSSFARIISKAHVERLAKLFEQGEVVCGGKHDPKDNYVAPTILKNPKLDSELMTDEIFGPILPIVRIESIEEAIDFINERPLPLALYYFGRNNATQEQVIARTRSGAAVMNELLLHFTNSNLPFGGVGESGIGAYHGKRTFESFVHKKAVVKSTVKNFLDLPLRYPPYNANMSWVIDKVTRSGW